MMGNDRYTSPETSRLLAEAGLEQKSGERVWCACKCASFDGTFRIKSDFHVCRVYSTRPGQSMPCLDPSHVRALDLTDVLHELVRPRPEEKDPRPLASYVQTETTTWGRFTCAVDNSDRPAGTLVLDNPSSTLEAAAKALLALLRERKS